MPDSGHRPRGEPEPRFESAVERQIRLAQERGAFDNLPLAGKPLPGAGQPYDENWWIRSWLEREVGSAEALLPESIQLRREIDRLPQKVRDMDTECEVRAAVRELNLRIAEHIRHPTGPNVPVTPVKVDDVVARWREERRARRRRPQQAPPPPPEPPEDATPPKRWWRRLLRLR
ncbi:protein of unknown function [Pseudonocardia thermophila]|uniref:DnaJ homologue subfamily C member 28 conserved domain-containing protein n=1 Tax=Pseudonocardia thermophila TaxID=1848 RepID=A0A1M6R4K2_PSETH|nr:DUF1992 domain-containing protein [Pseudonocardia thermophila]SHK27267.1 protein of unknown function [Pseudonocardia thermophila]